MPDGSIIFDTALDNAKLQKDLAKIKKEIEKLEGSVSGQLAKKSPLVQQAQELEQKMKAARIEAQRYGKAWQAGVSGADKDQSAAMAQIRQQEAQYVKVIGQIDKIDAKLLPAQDRLDQMNASAGGIEQQLSQAGVNTEKMDKATKKANKSAQRFALRLREVVRSALVFTLITQALAKFREWMGKVVRTNKEATAAIAKLKGALLTLAQPLVNIIIPAFTRLVNVLSSIISVIAAFVSAPFGSTVEQSVAAAENLGKEADAIAGVGYAARKAVKYLASFDKINRLTSEGSGGSGGNSTIAPDFSAIVRLPEWLKVLTADMALKINNLKFEWDNGTIAKSKDAWIVALTGILGAVIGSMFGGIVGGATGLVLGLLVGLALDSFLDKTDSPDRTKKTFIVVLSAILGGILGAMFGGVSGGVIGVLLGTAIGIISVEFLNGDLSSLDSGDTWFAVITAILSAVIGFAFGGLAGGLIGLLFGAFISIMALNFLNKIEDGGKEKSGFKIVLTAILGMIIGTIFGGFIGSAIGLVVGLSIGWACVMIDESISGNVKSAATKVLPVALTTIIGALIGAVFGGGVFGGIIGGVIGLVFGLAINFSDAKTSDFKGFSGTGSRAVRGTGFNAGKDLANGVTEGTKDGLGIHSPSTVFEDVGGNMMAGLDNGVSNNTGAVLSSYSGLTGQMVGVTQQATTEMQDLFKAFLQYIVGDFKTNWTNAWEYFHSSSRQKIQSIMREIDALNAKRASIERNITITITMVHKTVGSSSGSGTSTASRAASARVAAMPAALTAIPALARGAVIPPNREFLAVLGDQKTGTNIKAPLDTIVHAVMLALSKSGYGGGEQVIENILNLDGETIYRNQKKVARRHGVSLAGGRA